MKFLGIILFLCSCTASRRLQYTITLDGSASNAAPGQALLHVQWRDINGTATIQNPGVLVTNAVVSKSTTFELWGQQTDGQSAKDSMNVIIR